VARLTPLLDDPHDLVAERGWLRRLHDTTDGYRDQQSHHPHVFHSPPGGRCHVGTILPEHDGEIKPLSTVHFAHAVADLERGMTRSAEYRPETLVAIDAVERALELARRRVGAVALLLSLQTLSTIISL
jgi:hypothetical protein